MSEADSGVHDGPMGLPVARRRRVPGRRRTVVGVRLTAEERAELAAAAARVALTPAGYMAEVALAAARGEAGPDRRTIALREALVELLDARNQVRAVGVNLNQAVTALNATGEAPDDLAIKAARAGAAVDRLDRATIELGLAVRR